MRRYTPPSTPTLLTHGGLAEALLLVAPGGVGQVGGVLALDGDVVLEGDVADLDVIEGPGREQHTFGWGGRTGGGCRQEATRETMQTKHGSKANKPERGRERAHFLAVQQDLRVASKESDCRCTGHLKRHAVEHGEALQCAQSSSSERARALLSCSYCRCRYHEIKISSLSALACDTAQQ